MQSQSENDKIYIGEYLIKANQEANTTMTELESDSAFHYAKLSFLPIPPMLQQHFVGLQAKC